MRWRRLGLGLLLVVVTALLAVSVAIIWRPELLPGAWRMGLQSTAEEFMTDPTVILLLIGLMILLSELARSRYSQLTASSETGSTKVPVQERLQAREVRVTGSEQNQRLESTIGSMDVFDERPKQDMLGLEEVAIRILGRTEGYSPDEARTVLETGEWTDDPRAAMVFADITPPLRVRLVDRFRSQHRYERAVEAALTALESRLETARGGGRQDE